MNNMFQILAKQYSAILVVEDDRKACVDHQDKKGDSGEDPHLWRKYKKGKKGFTCILKNPEQDPFPTSLSGNVLHLARFNQQRLSPIVLNLSQNDYCCPIF